MPPKSPYTPEFREEAVQLALNSNKIISAVADELGLNRETLRGWVKKHKARQNPAAGAELTVHERARLKELERRNRELEMENSFLKSRSVLREGSPLSDKFEFIDQMRLDTVEYAYPVDFMCAKLDVSTSGYYDWRSRPESATSVRREELRALITKIFEDADSTYGYRRVHAQLRRWDVQAGPELVRQLMRGMGLVPCQPKPKRISLTKAGLPFPVPDLVGRNFTADNPGEKMVGDITYVPTGEGWLYLATVIDCCTKGVIGYAMDDHYQTPLISWAIEHAARNRKLARKAIFHSDRGSNYMSAEYGKTLDKLDLRRSASRTGICYDKPLSSHCAPLRLCG